MKKGLQILAGLTLLAALAEGLVVIRIGIDPWRLAALLESVALLVGAFVGLTQTALVKQLRHWAVASAALAAGLPFLLLIPYLIFGLGTQTFSLAALGKLIAYILVPTALLLPDRLRTRNTLAWRLAVAAPFLLLIPYSIFSMSTGAPTIAALVKLFVGVLVSIGLLLPDRAAHPEYLSWRDALAMLALAVPVSAGWLQGIWTWPVDIYVFRPIFCVLVGGYDFLVLRNLEGVGFRLVWNRRDISEALLNLLAFSLLAIPLGIALNFIHPHATTPLLHGPIFQVAWLENLARSLGPAVNVFFVFMGVYLAIAIPEEFLFRGVLQNLLVRTIRKGPPGLYGLLIASVVFGASHMHHPPVPNWRYAILATLAGIFYGNVYRTRQRLCASALTHALVDTIWHFWF